MMLSRLLLYSALVAGVCLGFSPAGPSAIIRPRSDSLLLLSASGDRAGEDESSVEATRRDVFGKAKATAIAAAGMTFGLADPANAYQVPLDKQVKAIESANYMGNFKPIYEANSSGAPEKHLPQVSVSGNDVAVSVPHVMTEEHYIKFIWLKDTKTNEIVVVKGLPPTDPSPPTLKVKVPSGVELRPYIFCNLHGLWKGEEFSVA